jgi:aryl-alcohol dehydrogenase-like predicted oxidoreductase
LKTPYFPIALYERDAERAQRLLSETTSPAKTALQFVLTHPAVSSAIIGFGSSDHVGAVAAGLS